MRSRWQYLSYLLSDKLSAYRNGQRISHRMVQSMDSGDVCNHSFVEMSLHFGTHVDFPSHFIANGRSLVDYEANHFVVHKVEAIFLKRLCDKHILRLSDLLPYLDKIGTDIECLIIKTGMTDVRAEDSYWEDSIGIDEGVSTYLRQHYPNLRFLGFDFISVSGSHYRELGRAVHKEMLSNNIMPIEDMDLSMLHPQDRIAELIISPLRVNRGEAAPVTVFAKLYSYD